VIHSVSEPFCDGCTRARLSADGKLFTCLFARRGHDLRALLREGAGDEEIERRLREVWVGRADRYSAERSRVSAQGNAEHTAEQIAEREPPKIEMSYIGG